MIRSFADELRQTSYPGRGILLGRSSDGAKAVAAYFIMGRSENSRNRIFEKEGEGIRTRAFDTAKLSDPSLILYSPVRVWRDITIVTNGDQTDTIYDGLSRGLSMEQSLRGRSFEPDAPNYTPRISGALQVSGGSCRYALSILKSDLGRPASCLRQFFSYGQPFAGEGHFLHTYLRDGEPLPSFSGEPVPVSIGGDIDAFAHEVWEALNFDNKISLFVRYIDISSGTYETRILNKHQRG